MIKDNNPNLWLSEFPQKSVDGHKYDYGHALIYAAPELTGATRLAAQACARIGAGLTTVLCSPETSSIYKSTLPAHIMVRDEYDWFDKRVTARLFGPGGLAKGVRVLLNRPAVIDADALLGLPQDLHENIVLTPHEGEFSRAFPEIAGTREERALAVAQKTGAVVVLKGRETLIASPDGQVVVNKCASPYLATAGTGDVLAGIITGLLAQGMSGFSAACAGVYVHGSASLMIGPGLVASDLEKKIVEVLKEELGIS